MCEKCEHGLDAEEPRAHGLRDGGCATATAGLILYATAPAADEHTREHRTALADPPRAYFADYWRRRTEFAHLLGALRCWPRPGTDFDFRSALPSISAPTIVVAGVHDFAFGPEPAEMLRSAHSQCGPGRVLRQRALPAPGRGGAPQPCGARVRPTGLRRRSRSASSRGRDGLDRETGCALVVT